MGVRFNNRESINKCKSRGGACARPVQNGRETELKKQNHWAGTGQWDFGGGKVSPWWKNGQGSGWLSGAVN